MCIVSDRYFEVTSFSINFFNLCHIYSFCPGWANLARERLHCKSEKKLFSSSSLVLICLMSVASIAQPFQNGCHIVTEGKWKYFRYRPSKWILARANRLSKMLRLCRAVW